ncbi:MAG TPA: hypothetical protein ENK63_01580 [Rhodobacterales bacterium]|nr:hypothetical protein [Rhodobacterales bacterium]
MPEPVSKTEIEDVLSSIRRLVADNAGAIRRESEHAEAPQGERLVLTPAFRVDDAKDDPRQDPADAVQAVEPQGEHSDGALDVAASDDTDGFETVASHETDEASAMTPWQDASADLSSAAAAPAEEGAADGDAMRSREEARPLSPLEQRIAELEAVVSRSSIEFEPDGSEDEALPDAVLFQHRQTNSDQASGAEEAPQAIRPENSGGLEPQADEDAQATLTGAGEADFEPGSAPGNAPESGVDETIAEGEDIPNWHQNEGEFDSVELEPAPEADIQTNGQADTSADGPAEPQASAEQISEPQDDWEDLDGVSDDEIGEAVIDEDALREMVARMVREELQGSVGERITHNVRRMVRREIARALSLQEVD